MAEITEAIPLWGQLTVDAFILLGENKWFQYMWLSAKYSQKHPN